jgi:NADH-quinone oxidoreductase subunit A
LGISSQAVEAHDVIGRGAARGAGAPRRSGTPGDDMQSWLSILMLIGAGVGFGVFTVTVSQWLGPRRPTPEKQAPYECGVPPVGDARERMSVKFYLVAMVFLLFDIEVAFLYPWAMALRDIGWYGYLQILLFTLVLAAGYVYIWRKGILDWGPPARRPVSTVRG